MIRLRNRRSQVRILSGALVRSSRARTYGQMVPMSVVADAIMGPEGPKGGSVLRKMWTVAFGVVAAAGCSVALVGSVGAHGLARSASSSVRLEGVSAVSASDVWAVGQTQGENQEPATLHWDGNTLSPVPTNLDSGAPGGIVPGELHGVSADAPAGVWAVGNVSPPREHVIQSLALRWDGSRWSRVATPNPSALSNDLYAVKANAPEDVWAEGEYLNTSNHQRRLF